MDDAKNVRLDSSPVTSRSTTSCPVHLEESPFCLTVRAVADPVTMARLIGKISRLLQKEGVSNASISGSANERPSAVGVVSTAA
jgi:hypothetical protein